MLNYSYTAGIYTYTVFLIGIVISHYVLFSISALVQGTLH